jgi:hypothetical protein
MLPWLHYRLTPVTVAMTPVAFAMAKPASIDNEQREP